MTVLKEKVELEVFQVWCGDFIAITAAELRELRKNHQDFYCPKGHTGHYPAENAEEKLRRRLRCAEDRNTGLSQQLTNAEGMLAVAEKAKRKLEQRVDNGVCPHCRRSFSNLRRHMQSKHKN